MRHKIAESFAAKTDIEARAKTVAGGGDIACQFELALVEGV